jgi:hypothetical protein
MAWDVDGFVMADGFRVSTGFGAISFSLMLGIGFIPVVI